MVKDEKFDNVVKAINNLSPDDFKKICENIENGMSWDKVLKHTKIT